MEFSSSDYDRNKRIVIYGAGIFGEYTKKALDVHGIDAYCFCDRKKDGKPYCGLPVISPSELVEKHNDAIILVAIGIEFAEVYRWLTKYNLKNIFSVKELIFNTQFSLEGMSVQAQDKQYYEIIYEWGLNSYFHKDKLSLSNVDWVITQKCSLHCKDCSNLMPYYECPTDYSFFDSSRYMDNFIDVVDEVLDIRILGGEPFMCRELADYLEYAIKKERIRNVTIYTNATILPNDKIRKLLCNKKVRLEITNYGALARNFDAFVKIIEMENIRHNIVELTEWHDLGGLYNRELNQEQREKVYAQCFCRNLPTFMEGKLFRCPYAANGRILKAIPFKDEDYIDFTNKISDRELTRKKIIKLLFESLSDYACGYCSGRNNHIAVVQPAIQTKHVLEYEKVTD